jgi:hypothetical protein
MNLLKAMIIAKTETEFEILMKMLADTSLQIVKITEEFPKTIVVFGSELCLIIFEKMIEIRNDNIERLEKCMQQ